MATGVLVLGFLAALGVLTYVFKRWPHVQRSFDVHVDDALSVVDERDEAEAKHERFRRLKEKGSPARFSSAAEAMEFADWLARELEAERDREQFERMIHPSAENGLIDLERGQS